MLDILQAIFWAITYVLIIFFAFTDKSKTKLFIPLTAIELNFAWEINAWYESGGYWIHVLWTILDIFVFSTHIFIVYNKLFSTTKKISHKRKQNKYQPYKTKKQIQHPVLKYSAIPFLIIMLIILTTAFHFVFKIEGWMLQLCFIIDIIMALSFLLSVAHLSLQGQIPIAITKLIGDTFAWLYYRNGAKFVNIIGILVLMINVCYLILVIVRHVHPSKFIRMKKEKN